VLGLRVPRPGRLGRPRRLGAAEAAALGARPWPKLPWWLWLAAMVTTVTMVVVAAGLFGATPASLPAGAGRSPPAAGLTHGVGDYRVPALAPGAAGRVVRLRPDCARLAGLTVVGTPGEAALLRAAVERLCAFRSTAPIERARQALERRRAEVAFAEFQLTGNESTTRLGPGRPLVLVNGKFATTGLPERIGVLLVHEGTLLAAGRPPTAGDELAAVKAELDACQRLPAGASPNRGCADAARLLAGDDAGALRALRAAGYR
jgi:hypothetical protein